MSQYRGYFVPGKVDPSGKGLRNLWNIITESCYCSVNCKAAGLIFASNARAKATRETKKFFGKPPQGSEGDAFRHCVANCDLVSCWGESCATCLGDAHEENNRTDSTDKQNIETHISMDLANNKAGRIAGKACHPNARNCCARACLSKLSAGGLVVAFPTGDPIPGVPGSITPPTLGDILDPQTNPGLPQIGQPK